MTSEDTPTTIAPIPAKDLLRNYVFSAYDLQKLRIQSGLRLCANFRSKLKKQAAAEVAPTDEQIAAGEGDTDKDGLNEEAQDIIRDLKESYKRLTDGIAKNRTLPEEKNFIGDPLISDYTELVLVNQYIRIEQNESAQFALFEKVLKNFPVYTDYLQHVSGIGPAMAAVLMAYLDPHKAERISDFWAYVGVDVAPDGFGRSRRAEHLIDRTYKNKKGQSAVRKSVTYNPWLKSRLLGVMGTSFMRTKDCPWKGVYDNYKHRLVSDPARIKVTSAQYKKLIEAKDPTARTVWPPLRIHRASVRYAVKMFLADLWLNWRRIEGLPVTASYHEAVLGHVHSGPAKEGPPRLQAAE